MLGAFFETPNGLLWPRSDFRRQGWSIGLAHHVPLVALCWNNPRFPDANYPLHTKSTLRIPPMLVGARGRENHKLVS